MERSEGAHVSVPDSLLSGSGGYLRTSVNVTCSEETWKIRHSLWEIELPVRAVDSEPHFLEFLNRVRPIRDVTLSTPAFSNLLYLLISQGCATSDGTRDTYTPDEVRYVVKALSSQWYGIYYSSKFWKRLNSCELSTQELFAWALRTYHLSRSAGVTAARGALHSPNERVRSAFLKSAIEEYSHCEIYYFPQHPVFGLEEDWIKRLLPLPSSTAFDHQMGVIAEEDWLAHTFVAYFQEYTAGFRESAFELYDRLESAYALDHFFDGWKDHIGYDVNQTHCADFEDLMHGDYRVSRQSLLQSIEAAAITVEYLIGALDELAAMDPKWTLREIRVPPSLIEFGATRSSVLGGIEDLSAFIDKPGYVGICDSLDSAICQLPKNQKNKIAAVVGAAILPVLASLLLRALGRCSSQSEVMLLGNLLEEMQRTYPPGLSTNASDDTGHRAISNFLREHITHPIDFVFLLLLACRMARKEPSEFEPDTLKNVNRIIEERLGKMSPSMSDRGRIVELGLQFAEICQATIRFWQNIPEQDVLLERHQQIAYAKS